MRSENPRIRLNNNPISDIIQSVVSVIIVNYNTQEITLKALAALYASMGVNLEVILVDNASTDGSLEEIGKRYKDIKIIENKKNKGFGSANNQGMRVAKGKYVLLLNSDCFVEKDTLRRLLRASQDKRLDVVGCKLLNQDGSTQQSWGYFPNLRRIVQMMFFVDNLPAVRNIIDSVHVRALKRYETACEVDWVTGAFMLMKREVYEKTGGFDEHFFMYGEEIEWQYRIKQLGFKIWFSPDAVAVHLVGASSPTRAPAIIGEIEGWKYWFAKYHPGWQETVLRLVVVTGCLLRILLKPQWSKYYREAIDAI